MESWFRFRAPLHFVNQLTKIPSNESIGSFTKSSLSRKQSHLLLLFIALIYKIFYHYGDNALQQYRARLVHVPAGHALVMYQSPQSPGTLRLDPNPIRVRRRALYTLATLLVLSKAAITTIVFKANLLATTCHKNRERVLMLPWTAWYNWLPSPQGLLIFEDRLKKLFLKRTVFFWYLL